MQTLLNINCRYRRTGRHPYCYKVKQICVGFVFKLEVVWKLIIFLLTCPIFQHACFVTRYSHVVHMVELKTRCMLLQCREDACIHTLRVRRGTQWEVYGENLQNSWRSENNLVAHCFDNSTPSCLVDSALAMYAPVKHS